MQVVSEIVNFGQEESRMAEQVKILLKAEQKPEAVAVLQLLGEMTTEEQREFLVFMQGVRFIKSLERKKTTAAAQTV